ncbi:MAG: hypothetical protein HRU38_20395 [Saccharospirillaceae bacterium]|nr:hypothetical protein [Pseudomonadales bacterium]NRB80993.1 hypothetical protein [Saccharospirillaceae bacterium]
MSPEVLNGLINIAISLYAALIGWEVVAIKISEKNKPKWERYKPIVKWAGTIGTAGFTALFIMDFM